MEIYNYLKDYQKIPYQLFKKALENNSFSHAYLLSGQLGTPLLDIALFIAKSIYQDNHTFYNYDENFEEKLKHGYIDNFLIIDGKDQKIKIDEIRNLENIFSKTTASKNNIKIYIINCVENLRDNAVSVLLKFLEEPPKDTYAFLTTENEYKILPTIKSRTQIIKFSPLNRRVLIENSIVLGISQLDAFLLSNMFNSEEAIKEFSLNEDYLKSKDGMILFIENLPNRKLLRLSIEHNFLSVNSKNLNVIKLFLDLLIIMFKESLNYKITNSTALTNEIDLLTNIIKYISNINKAILLLMNLKEEMNYNINVNLLIINLINKVYGE